MGSNSSASRLAASRREPLASMIGSLRVAAVQLRAHDRSAFLQSLDPIIETVVKRPAIADLVVLPEATFPAYVLGRARLDEATIAAALDRLREIARTTKTVIVVGAAAPTDSGLRNAALSSSIPMARSRGAPTSFSYGTSTAAGSRRAKRRPRRNVDRRTRRAGLRRRATTDDCARTRRARRAAHW